VSNYFNFIRNELPQGRKLSEGDFIAITLDNGKTVEGRLLSYNEYYLALEMYIGDTPLHESEDVQEFADGNAGFIIDFTVFPLKEISSFTKYRKLQTKKDKDGQEKT